MAQHIITVCDACGREIAPTTVADIINDKRSKTPIHIRAYGELNDKGFNDRGYITIMTTNWVTTIWEEVSQLDFCDTVCMVDYINNHNPVLLQQE